MKTVTLKSSHAVYGLLRPVLFLSDSEKVHERMTRAGQVLGNYFFSKKILETAWRVKSPMLEQKIHGISFENPLGLAAGFDYEARLTQILPSIGFGFGTVGTITNNPYGGNPPPLLGRLVKSQSLLVNKGFKNLGIKKTLERLEGKKFRFPVGISIGKTNSQEPMTQEEAVGDIMAAFRAVENSPVPFSYYEMNISCPNLYGNVEFYSPAHLADLLKKITGLNLTKPLFIKMPIEKSDQEVLAMLNVISEAAVQGVIFGNLQKNKNDPALVPEEVKKYSRGYYSGKPTQKRSDELISLAYKNFEKKLTIIGCGGVFFAQDAYRKIKLGASLVQMITGLVYKGPQLPGEINMGLVKLLKKDGFSNISEAIGRGI